MSYSDLFTWDHPYDEHVLVHHDNVVSCMIEWSGIDFDLSTRDECAAKLSVVEEFLRSLNDEYVYEFHFWRYKNAKPLKRYLDYNHKLVRAKQFCTYIRTELAKHLAPFAMSNRVAIVITTRPKVLFGREKKRLIKTGRDAEKLVRYAKTLLSLLPSATLATNKRYCERIKESYNRKWERHNSRFEFDHAYSVNEQLIDAVPTVHGSLIQLNERLTKVFMVLKYPDANPGWFLDVALIDCEMHISHIVVPVDSTKAIVSADKASDTADGMAVGSGSILQSDKAKSFRDFQIHVNSNKLQVMRNLLVIHLHGTAEDIERASIKLFRIFNQGGELRDADYVQKYYLRVGLPGQGYLGDVMRPDEHKQIAAMLPVQVWSEGESVAEIVRLNHSGQIQTYGITNKDVASTFVAAMTRGGKDALNGTEMAQFYGFGVNINLLEFAPSNRFVIEACGGRYLTLDENSIINPLPDYSIVDENADVPLSIDIANNTIEGIKILFLEDGREKLTNVQRAALESALQHVYIQAPENKVAPVLPDLQVELENLDPDYHSEDEVIAAKAMASKLGSFLATSNGKLFTKQGNVDLSGDLVGVDLQKIKKLDEELALFYMIFIGLNFTQKAFMNRKFTFVVLNELYHLVKVNPAMVSNLCSAISRMGSKERTYLRILTQHTAEVDALDRAVLAQMPRQDLLFMRSDHEHVAERIELPAGPLAEWKSFEYPVGKPFRDAIYCYGKDEFARHKIRLPKFHLYLMESSAEALDIKDDVAQLTPDIHQRIQMFAKRFESLPN